jgi:hypothetical protein
LALVNKESKGALFLNSSPLMIMKNVVRPVFYQISSTYRRMYMKLNKNVYTKPSYADFLSHLAVAAGSISENKNYYVEVIRKVDRLLDLKAAEKGLLECLLNDDAFFSGKWLGGILKTVGSYHIVEEIELMILSVACIKGLPAKNVNEVYSLLNMRSEILSDGNIGQCILFRENGEIIVASEDSDEVSGSEVSND